MRWGVFDKEENIHVAPVNDEKYLIKPHTLDELCCCSPEIRQGENGRLIVIHKEEN